MGVQIYTEVKQQGTQMERIRENKTKEVGTPK